jgi:hypothetical protein
MYSRVQGSEVRGQRSEVRGQRKVRYIEGLLAWVGSIRLTERLRLYIEQDPRSGSFKNKSSLQKLLLSELADANLAEIFVGLEARWLI